jgi:hypothetical protein
MLRWPIESFTFETPTEQCHSRGICRNVSPYSVRPLSVDRVPDEAFVVTACVVEGLFVGNSLGRQCTSEMYLDT